MQQRDLGLRSPPQRAPKTRRLPPSPSPGTIPLEAAATARGCGVLALGGDLEPAFAAQAHRNAYASALARRQPAAAGADAGAGPAVLPLAAAAAVLAEDGREPRPDETPSWHYDERLYERAPRAGGGGAPQVARWSAAQLPLRAGCVDAVVVDLPFGSSHKMKGGGARALYPRATLEAARVLRAGGRFVALTPALRVLADCLDQQRPLWAAADAQPVNCGGILAWVCVWTRSHEPVPQTAGALAASVPKRAAAKGRRAAPSTNRTEQQPGGVVLSLRATGRESVEAAVRVK